MVFGDVNFTSILHHLLEMLLESHLRLMMSVLCCFSLDVLRLTGAAPMTERSITIEQCPGRRLQMPQIFLHTSDIHLCLNCFSDQPNDAEVDKATPKRLYTRRITLLLCIDVDPSGILCYGTTICANLLEGVEQSKTGGFFSFGVSFEEKT